MVNPALGGTSTLSVFYIIYGHTGVPSTLIFTAVVNKTRLRFGFFYVTQAPG
jgi:hypothetical protein